MNNKQLQQAIHSGAKFKYLGFWGTHSETLEQQIFSNFYQYDFTAPLLKQTLEETEDFHIFSCSEQYFMYAKAVYFNAPKNTIVDLLKSGLAPAYYKNIGRRGIPNYVDEDWAKVRYAVMVKALTYKFGAGKLRQVLLNTGDKILVECSPVDRIWGIGLARYKDGKELQNGWDDPFKWRGENLLGQALMEVRDLIK